MDKENKLFNNMVYICIIQNIEVVSKADINTTDCVY